MSISQSGPWEYHGNIKSSNVLFDKSGNSCISDFGLVVLISPTSAASRDVGYRAPEQAETRKISQKVDVYSFGVLLLEILTGKAPIQLNTPDESIDLPKWVQSVVREEWKAGVFDLELMRYNKIKEEMVGMLQISMVCVSVSPEKRPKMSHVVKMIFNTVHLRPEIDEVNIHGFFLLSDIRDEDRLSLGMKQKILYKWV